jgi:hypothetical protein
MFLENATGGLLVQSMPNNPGSWSILLVRLDGTVTPWAAMCDTNKIDLDIEGLVLPSGINIGVRPDAQPAWAQRVMDGKIKDAFILGTMVYEIFTFMNCRNVVMHTYRPSRRELSNVAKVLQPHCIYGVLDIYRDRKVFESMTDVLEFLQPSDYERLVQRAGLVRGHFKNRKTGLWWWNFYIRNRHNSQKVGEVVNDYELHAAA